MDDDDKINSNVSPNFKWNNLTTNYKTIVITTTQEYNIITTTTEFHQHSDIHYNINSHNHNNNDDVHTTKEYNNYWALLALLLVLFTAAGNILVCLAIAWERRLQNVTNYFLMSLAITDLMVAVLVMPLGILTLVRGYFPLQSEHCLVWICLDVLFCTASIMHLCTISVDRYLSLRYPMRFGRNKTRRRVTLKIVFVWLLSIAMSLPLSLMYSKDHASVLVDGTCQIPDPVYKLVGSIVCFYIPLGVMLLTYYLTIRLLARQRQNLGGPPHTGGWASGWLGHAPALERRCTWKKLLKTSTSLIPNHPHSGASTDTELSTLDTHDLWLPDSSIPEQPPPNTMTALHQFGAEMLKLSRGLENVVSEPKTEFLSPHHYHHHHHHHHHHHRTSSSSDNRQQTRIINSLVNNNNNSKIMEPSSPIHSMCEINHRKRRASCDYWEIKASEHLVPRRRFSSLPPTTNISSERVDELMNQIKESRTSKEKDDTLVLPPPCTCPYFGDKSNHLNTAMRPTEVKIIQSSPSFRHSTCLNNNNNNNNNSEPNQRLSISVSSNSTTTNTSSSKSLSLLPTTSPIRKLSYSKTNSIVTWDSRRYQQRRGSSFGGTKTSLLTPSKAQLQITSSPLRRSATLKYHNNTIKDDELFDKGLKIPSSPCLLQRTTTIRSHHSRNSSVVSRNSSRHGRIIRLEQKATKVLGVVFFTFVILWAPFFVLNLLPTVCQECESKISQSVFDIVTWLGYASSMVNPIFYTIFNKVFRQAFKKVLLCKYRRKSNWRPHR